MKSDELWFWWNALFACFDLVVLTFADGLVKLGIGVVLLGHGALLSYYHRELTSSPP